eukprot:Opistho-2@96219
MHTMTEAHSPSLGVCYYPEQWPRDKWETDAASMRALGIRHVRIGEFAWAVCEPTRNNFRWEVLDDAIEVLGSAGLSVVMGTPTACPPKWLVDEHPDILPVDVNGHVRKFGSRRHYNFSSAAFRRETERIVTAFAERYGGHPAVSGWQIDNEFGCHDTVRSFDCESRECFREWLSHRYRSICDLNSAWGNSFWSMDYASFDEVDLPNLTVTEANPAHWLDYCRFSSDQVVSYAQLQAGIVRRLSPGRFVTTNMMGFFFLYDHFALGDVLDFAAWDSYPLGFTDTAMMPHAITDADKVQYARTGHPDLAAFHHDLYRGVGHGRFWVMEQQPGPVNWANNNPSPAPGMVRLWTLEAIAHGADVVSYFRWRQCPFAQEQMHSGLNRPDYTPDVAYGEAADALEDMRRLQSHLQHPRPAAAPTAISAAATVSASTTTRGDAALVFDYEAAWVLAIQPQGALFSYPELVYIFYCALRRIGLSVDIVSPDADLSVYPVVVVPSSPIVGEHLAAQLAAHPGHVLLGPRTGCKTRDFQIPATLAPGAGVQRSLPVRVVRVESLRAGMSVGVTGHGGLSARAGVWAEWVVPIDSTDASPVDETARFDDGRPAIVANTNAAGGRCHYVAFYPDVAFLSGYVRALLAESAVNAGSGALAASLRLRRRGNVMFAFNYDTTCNAVAPAPAGAQFLVGSRYLAPCDACAWTV